MAYNERNSNIENERTMRLKIVASILFAFVACIWVSGAMASSHHHHEQHQAVSPFDNTQVAPSAHCILKNHAHFGFCPHSLLPKDYVAEFQIASDCGGKTPGTVPSNISASKNLTVLPATREAPVFMIVENMTRVAPSYDFHFLDPLDHPPRFS